MIHTVTKEVTIESIVRVVASPGENPISVLRQAKKQHQEVVEEWAPFSTTAEVSVEPPVYEEHRRWLVKFKSVFRLSEVVELD